MSEDAHDSGYPLTIKGECAQCHLVYTVEGQPQCPQCTEVALVWATNVTQLGVVYRKSWDDLPSVEDIRKKLGYTRTEEEIKDIEWLENLFQLRDTK